MKIHLLAVLMAGIAFLTSSVRAQGDPADGTNCDDPVLATNLICTDPIPVDPPIWTIPAVSNSTTTVSGISGGVIVGSFVDSSQMTEGFAYDGTNYTVIDHPEASGFTEVRGFSGGTYAGNFTDSNGVTHGFLYDGTKYTTVDVPDANGCTSITGFDGVSYVGNFTDTNWTSRGFVYDGTNYTTFVHPDSVDGSAYLNGFSSGVIFGSYPDTSYVTHGFLYDGTNFTAIDYPGAPWFTEVTGFFGGNVAGNYIDTNGVTHGFLYDGTKYTTVDAPDANGYTSITGFDGVSYAGSFIDANGSTHGFLYDGTNYTVIDEPGAAQIPQWFAWNSLGSFPTMFGSGNNSRRGVAGSAPKPQRIRIRTAKPALKKGDSVPSVRVVASAPAGAVNFTVSGNAVVTPPSTYWAEKQHVYVTTATVKVYNAGKVKVTASQLGNSRFAPAKPVVIPNLIKKK